MIEPLLTKFSYRSFHHFFFIFVVLGSIMSGIATVNQAGAIGAAGALIMAGYRLTDGQKGCYYPAILCLIKSLCSWINSIKF